MFGILDIQSSHYLHIYIYILNNIYKQFNLYVR